MKKTLLSLSVLATFSCAFAEENNDLWYGFRGGEKELVGFKNADGEVMIEPKFEAFSRTQIFDHIIGVSERDEKTQALAFYFLTKSGNVIDKTPYISDMTMDCEYENYIRFRDDKSRLVGLLNAQGEVVIPAEYSDLTKVQNGVLAGLKNAKRVCAVDDIPEAQCEMKVWHGGEDVLLTPKNEILVKGLSEKPSALDFYSLRVQDAPDSRDNTVNMRGENGKYYVFDRKGDHFRDWVYKQLGDIDAKALETLSLPIIETSNPAYRGEMSRSLFFALNGETVAKKLREVGNKSRDFFLSGGSPLDDRRHAQYLDNCGNDSLRYPNYDIVTTHEQLGFGRNQDHFDFIKTDEGYRLYHVTLRTAPMWSGDMLVDTYGWIGFERNLLGRDTQ